MKLPVRRVGLRERATRLLVRALPSDVGLWRLRPHLPACPDSDELTECRLRGFPLRMRFHASTYSGWFLYYRGLYEEGCVKAFTRLLRPGMTILDAGANCGMYTLIGAQVVGPTGRVLAVEPQPELAKIISGNVTLNELANVDVATCALGVTSGSGTLHHPSRSNDGQATLALAEGEKSFGSESVPVRSLPELMATHDLPSVSAIKIDVEGAELRVLEGAVSIFDTSPPEFVLFECIDSHLRRFGDSAPALIEFFLSRSYQMRCLHRGRWLPVNGLLDYRKAHQSPDVIALRADVASPF